MKKGFTLIELLVSIGIMLILLTCELNIFSHFVFSSKIDHNYKRNDFYLKEALMFIGEQVNKAQNVKVINNEIEITRIPGDSVSNAIYTDRISIYNNNVIVKYYRNGVFNGQNNIVTKVADLKVQLINSVLYVKIQDNNGKEIERCFTVKTMK